jgi:hypothetical protein
MKVKNFFSLVVIFSMLSAFGATGITDMSYASARTAYDFSLSDQDGKLRQLSDFLKDYRGVVLAFYPLDDKRG